MMEPYIFLSIDILILGEILPVTGKKYYPYRCGVTVFPCLCNKYIENFMVSK